jgi:methyl-accepting chemotaxis protein
MRQLVAGDHNFDIPCVRRGDELGRMAESILVFRDTAIAERKAAEEKKIADAEQKMVVETVGAHLSSLAQGDLTATINTDFPATYAELKNSYNAALDSLRHLIAAVAESTLQIRTGSSEIAQASEDLARRTESNAASLEETSAAITQMDGRLKATATAAGRTVERADQAIATVGGGRSIADEAVQAMGRVSDSAKGIDDVIEGLDKIAFQTRVLAMNAAVEAGRAGEAGRGFAVVADLVSALAMRAEEEAKRARDQLTVTQTDISTAVEAVQKVDGALANISSDVGEVHKLLNTMAADNQSQASAITQISAAISSMDQATQQNAAMVEETSAAARNLTTEVNGLADQASQFRFEEKHARQAVAAKASKANGIKVDNGSPAKNKGVNGEAYVSPVKALPSAAVAALTRPDDDWNQF